ncbi:MAG TPA: hypothetical protein VN193_17585 [Candidatus Angelobacter sp.]|jgi:hypothetical protein|nr:hypothetical protein [Candidatus Angelobacter sp.]
MTTEVNQAAPDPRWYAVRCIFHHAELGTYEERITLWRADDGEEAVAKAESEASEYAAALEDVHDLGLQQAFHLFDEPGEGGEVFSLMRASALEPREYVTRFFDTGLEREQQI